MDENTTLLTDILAELKEQRERLDSIENQLTHRSSPKRTIPRNALTIRCVTACKENEVWYWMNSVTGPGHRPTTNQGLTTKGEIRAKLLALYSAAQQVLQYQLAFKMLCVCTTNVWIKEMIETDTPPSNIISEDNWELANDILDMLFKFPKVDAKHITFTEDTLLVELAEKLLEIKDGEEKACSQPAATESSLKTAKLSSDKAPTECSSTSTCGSKIPINLEGI